MKILKLIIGGIINFFGILFTGGKYGSSIPSDHSSDYAQRQEQRRKDFANFGTRECKMCYTKIPGNKSYCGPCYYKHVKT